MSPSLLAKLTAILLIVAGVAMALQWIKHAGP